MTIQEIIDTYNYSAVTGCRLTRAASENLCSEIMKVLDPQSDKKVDRNGKNFRPLFVDLGEEVPEGFVTFTGYKPRTKSLSRNYVELELLRILFKLKPDAPMLAGMLETTKDRVNHTCFGQFCGKGECLEMSIIALRFRASILPEDLGWIDQMVDSIMSVIRGRERKLSKRAILMFTQVVSELRRLKDAELMDELLWYIDDNHLHFTSEVSAEINDCILYSCLRRSVLAS